MSLALRGTPTNATSVNPSTMTVNKPTGVVDHDLLLAFCINCTPPASPAWTLVGSITTAAQSYCYIYKKEASSEGASWGFVADYISSAIVVAYQNVDGVCPVVDKKSSSWKSFTANGSCSIDDISAVTGETLVAMFAGARSDAATPTFSTPTTMTKEANTFVTKGAGLNMDSVNYVFDEILGTNGARASTLALCGTGQYYGFMLSLTPGTASELYTQLERFHPRGVSRGIFR